MTTQQVLDGPQWARVAAMTWRELVDQLHASTAADDAAHMVEQLGRLR